MIAATSADCANPIARVTTGGLVLLTAFVSSVDALTLAVLVMEPLADAFTVKVRLLDWPMFNVPNVQFTTPPAFTPPPEALTKVRLAGNASVTTTLLAVDGPRLVMERV